MDIQSPKFPIRKIEISTFIKPAKIKKCWKKKVRISLKKSILGDPLEWLDFHVRIDQISVELEASLLSGSYRTSAPDRFRMEKSKGLCRQITLPSPEDAIVLQLFSDALYRQIKDQEPTKKAFFAPEDHSFSTQKKEESGGSDYGSFAAWMNFQESIFGFSKTYNFLVITDVANYYDFINHSHLRNIISGAIDVKESILDVLIYSLSGLLWEPDYMPRISIGLPQMNEDAPRILAHCFLYELDRFLNEAPDCDFTRYMDDIDIGVDSIQRAKSILRDIDLILQTRQVRLNSGKTKIITAQEATHHFRIRENRILDAVSETIKRKRTKQLSLEREKRHLSSFFSKGLQRGYFNDGNGEKILKRILSISISCYAQLSEEKILQVIKLRPSARANALRYQQSKKISLSFLTKITHLINEQNFVDHASFQLIANTLVQSCSRKDKRIEEQIAIIVRYLTTSNDTINLIAAIKLSQKYLSSEILYNLIVGNLKLWQIDKIAGRFVGSALPYFVGTIEREKFVNCVNSSKNTHAINALNFSKALSDEEAVLSSIFNFVKAPNKTLPLQITPAKFGMFLMAIKNSNLTQEKQNLLLATHQQFKNDAYLKNHFDRIQNS